MTAKIMLTPSRVKEFVAVTTACDFDIDIAGNNRYVVDAKSIVGVYGLDMTRPLTISYDGYNAALEAFITANQAAS